MIVHKMSIWTQWMIPTIKEGFFSLWKYERVYHYLNVVYISHIREILETALSAFKQFWTAASLSLWVPTQLCQLSTNLTYSDNFQFSKMSVFVILYFVLL